jgi:CubicO group peptidase (beta-lactamase class C family)
MSSERLAEIDAIIGSAIVAGATPGAAIAVGRRGRLVMLRGYGRLDWRDDFALVTDSTLYDLASLTKVIATTTLVMMLVDDGLLDLDAPLSRYLPEWRSDGDRGRVSVRNLLLHDSGLPAYSALYNELRGLDAYVRRIGSLTLQYEPGTATVYSDFGPILLAAIIERVSGRRFEELLEERLTRPLGMRETRFNPVGPPDWVAVLEAAAESDDGAAAAPRAARSLLGRIAPTEIDTAFRRFHLHGRVHDENAYALGGIAGHAGLFSSVRDLARFAQMLLDGGVYDGRRYVQRATVETFTRRQSGASSRALGWDTPTGLSSAGDYFSARSFGHTGFTGTSLWIDPERDLFVVLLTNRVNPTRANQLHVPLRRAVADAVQRAILDAPLHRR